MEITIVRRNMIQDKSYRPYCMRCSGLQRMSTQLPNLQLQCPKCGIVTEFPQDFISRYKQAHK